MSPAVLDTPSMSPTANVGEVQNTDGLLNFLVQARKMANHPLLHRVMYTDERLKEMAARIMGEPQYVTPLASSRNGLRRPTHLAASVCHGHICSCAVSRPFAVASRRLSRAIAGRTLRTVVFVGYIFVPPYQVSL